MIVRALIVWFRIAMAEVLHGVLRMALLDRRLGDRPARQTGVFTGSALILLISWLAVPWLGVTTTSDCLAIGTFWLILMLAFEVAFGRWVLRASWKRLAADFEPPEVLRFHGFSLQATSGPIPQASRMNTIFVGRDAYRDKDDHEDADSEC